MIDLLAAKSNSADVLISLAKLHLSNDEWGRARMVVEEAIGRGNLSDEVEAFDLLQEIDHRLGLKVDIPAQ